jgi:hypothetical protein
VNFNQLEFKAINQVKTGEFMGTYEFVIKLVLLLIIAGVAVKTMIDFRRKGRHEEES